MQISGIDVRDVRLAAASTLSDVRAPDVTDPTLRAALEKAFGEYLAAQRLNADRAEHWVNLAGFHFRQGRVEEAEAVYRADLGLDASLSRACQHPDNVWSLHGLHECLARRGEQELSTIIKQRLDLAVARADVAITSSCYCRMRDAA